MRVLLKYTTQSKTFLLVTALACSSALAQNASRPDLEGIWTNASLTNLQRPQGVDSLIVSPEEAQVIAAATPIAGIEGGLDEGDGVGLAVATQRVLRVVDDADADAGMLLPRISEGGHRAVALAGETQRLGALPQGHLDAFVLPFGKTIVGQRQR